MKIIWILLACAVLMSGCSSEPTYETVGDGHLSQVIAQQKNISISVDEYAEILQSDSGTLYLCDGYEVAVQVLAGGDLEATVQTVSGFDREVLTLLQTACGELNRYECAWSAVGEDGQTVCSAVILDDGAYHYCVSVIADESSAYRLRQDIRDLFDSIELH